MKQTLMLYTEGNFKNISALYANTKDHTLFINTKRNSLKDTIQGMRFVTICIHDLGVSLEDEAYAHSRQVSQKKWNTLNKTPTKNKLFYDGQELVGHEVSDFITLVPKGE